ncbi:hypothetical protein [Alteromonas macleodii]|uniref:Uncharacterized protein n=1 Tax=Alteromonas macleodii TaxID=28108 RepID=A0AB36FL01_ALTMA|nr:hypothetical protein [Alteromonas macleodii]OES24129.1 hypothetical protein BFV93_4729 [Alteromonas macleodii]OES24763.1 hypothetical protein BFV95_4522 [Alteromonas macleodii]OES25041.1 hypothetical protein BFV94_4512 [Alteromonas macleodii]OES39084.1 hypothetical protein BFV96_4232 [Alteromonas macleodii]
MKIKHIGEFEEQNEGFEIVDVCAIVTAIALVGWALFCVVIESRVLMPFALIPLALFAACVFYRQAIDKQAKRKSAAMFQEHYKGFDKAILVEMRQSDEFSDYEQKLIKELLNTHFPGWSLPTLQAQQM